MFQYVVLRPSVFCEIHFFVRDDLHKRTVHFTHNQNMYSKVYTYIMNYMDGIRLLRDVI